MSIFSSNGTWGAGYIYSASGLLNDLKILGEVMTTDRDAMQAGELYMYGINEVTATGYFRVPYGKTPYVMFTPHVSPSGTYRVSASGVNSFTVRFTTTPFGNNFTLNNILKLGTWTSNVYPH